MKMSVGNIDIFDPASGNWKLYIERLEQYFLLNNIKEHLKVPTLITLMGGTSYELLVTLCAPQKPSTMTFDDVVKTMSDHLYPKPCILAERYKFRQRKQYNGETISEYVAELKKLAIKCEFRKSLDENLRDQLVCGIQCETTRQRLFAEDELDFRTALAIAHSLEAGEEPSSEYNDDELMPRPVFTSAVTVANGSYVSDDPSGEYYDEGEVSMSQSDESEADDDRPLKNKRRKNKSWIFLKKFVNSKEAEEFVIKENTWSRIFARTNKEGFKQFYRCNKVKKRGRQCAAELSLFFVNDSDDVLVYRTDADHNHDEIGTRGHYGLPKQTKIAIDKLLEQRLKPNSILHALAKMDGIKLPKKTQLNNYLADKRRAKYEKMRDTSDTRDIEKGSQSTSTQIKTEAAT